MECGNINCHINDMHGDMVSSRANGDDFTIFSYSCMGMMLVMEGERRRAIWPDFISLAPVYLYSLPLRLNVER